MREIVHLQAGQCGNQIGGKVTIQNCFIMVIMEFVNEVVESNMAIPRCQLLFAVLTGRCLLNVVAYNGLNLLKVK